MYKVGKAVFEREDEGPTVEFKKRERSAEANYGRDEDDRNINRQNAIQKIGTSGRADDVDKLSERKGAEDPIFDLNELRNLELHSVGTGVRCQVLGARNARVALLAANSASFRPLQSVPLFYYSLSHCRATIYEQL